MRDLTTIRTGLIILIGMLISACGSNQLKPEIKTKIQTTEVHLIIKQAEIYGNTVHNLGGLATAFGGFEAKNAKEERRKRNEKAMIPVVKALKGYKVKSLAQRVYESGLKQVSWMKPTKVKIVKREIEQDERFTITKNSRADAVIFVELDYRINDTFRNFEVVTKSQMFYETEKDPEARPEIIHRVNHTYSWKLPGTDGIYDHQELGKKWSKLGKKALKQKIREGIESEVNYLVSTLQKS